MVRKLERGAQRFLGITDAQSKILVRVGGVALAAYAGYNVLSALGLIDRDASGVRVFDHSRLLAQPSVLSEFVAMPTGAIPMSHLIWTQENAEAIYLRVRDFVEAPGIVHDNEERAVSIIQGLPNPYAVAFFNASLFTDYAYSIAAYGAEFLEDRHKAAIGRHLKSIGGYPNAYGLTMTI